MTIDVRPVVEQALRAALRATPIDGIDIVERLDHADEEALYIVVRLPPSTPLVGGETYLAAMTDVSEALLKIGDRRFPYVRLDHLGEEEADEGDPVRASMR